MIQEPPVIYSFQHEYVVRFLAKRQRQLGNRLQIGLCLLGSDTSSRKATIQTRRVADNCLAVAVIAHEVSAIIRRIDQQDGLFLPYGHLSYRNSIQQLHVAVPFLKQGNPVALVPANGIRISQDGSGLTGSSNRERSHSLAGVCRSFSDARFRIGQHRSLPAGAQKDRQACQDG